MKIGYARVSTQDQGLSLQMDALQKAGCEKIYKEKISGATQDRPELQKMLEHVRDGDVVVIWKLDRLARSLKDLIEMVGKLQSQGVALQSVTDQIDTTTPHGKLTFHLFAALAEFERDIIRERTKAGLAAARARGRIGGRPKGLSKKAQNTAIIAEKLYNDQQMTVKEICEQLGISRRTFYNYLEYRGVKVGDKALK
jgi:DNA invertase Pin-like site-specific DNA recombinase